MFTKGRGKTFFGKKERFMVGGGERRRTVVWIREQKFFLWNVLIFGVVAVIGLTVFGSRTVWAEETPSYEVEEYRLGERTLRRGSWGADVFALQLRLQELGYSIPATGLFGEQTDETIRSFQREHGLPVTGAVNDETLTVLLSLGDQTTLYTVEPGDSLWSIAQQFDTTMEALFDMNNLSSSVLRVGQTLLVPAPRTYTVREGESLWTIARRFNTTVSRLAEFNGLDPDAALLVGTELRLPPTD